MSIQTIKIVNMTSTEVFKLQANNIFASLRHINTETDDEVVFVPTHIGGVLGQKEILESCSIMRQTKVTQ